METMAGHTAILACSSYSARVQKENMVLVPDLVSRNRDVVLVRRIFSSGKPWGVRNLEWGENGEGMGRGRSVYE